MPEKVYKAQLVKATIWANVQTDKTTKKEYTVHSVQLSRSYKNADDEWKDTTSMRKVDMPIAIALLQQSYNYLLGLTNEASDDEADEE